MSQPYCTYSGCSLLHHASFVTRDLQIEIEHEVDAEGNKVPLRAEL